MRLIRILVAVFMLLSAGIAAGSPPQPASAAATLAIAPASWGVIGLDSNRVTDGPDTFMVGAVVTNTGTLAATGLVATWVWDSANANINLDPASINPVNFATLGPGQQTYFYFNVRVNRTSAAYDT